MVCPHSWSKEEENGLPVAVDVVVEANLPSEKKRSGKTPHACFELLAVADELAAAVEVGLV